MLTSVILTVRAEQSGIEHDMELPANIPGAELCGRLLAALKNLDEQVFSTAEKINIRIERSGRLLGEEQTLEEAEVWDGSIITAVK